MYMYIFIFCLYCFPYYNNFYFGRFNVVYTIKIAGEKIVYHLMIALPPQENLVGLPPLAPLSRNYTTASTKIDNIYTVFLEYQNQGLRPKLK